MIFSLHLSTEKIYMFSQGSLLPRTTCTEPSSQERWAVRASQRHWTAYPSFIPMP